MGRDRQRARAERAKRRRDLGASVRASVPETFAWPTEEDDCVMCRLPEDEQLAAMYAIRMFGEAWVPGADGELHKFVLCAEADSTEELLGQVKDVAKRWDALGRAPELHEL